MTGLRVIRTCDSEPPLKSRPGTALDVDAFCLMQSFNRASASRRHSVIRYSPQTLRVYARCPCRVVPIVRFVNTTALRRTYPDEERREDGLGREFEFCPPASATLGEPSHRRATLLSAPYTEADLHARESTR